MNYKDTYDQLSDLCRKYCLISGQADIIKTAEGKYHFLKISENDYIVVAGCFPEDLIIRSFEDFECTVEQDGYYDFRALLSYSAAQIGNYPPPNLEVESYMMIEHIEYKRIC